MSAPIVFTRRLLLIAIAALTALLMTSAATPAAAEAAALRPTDAYPSPDHVGWVNVRPRAVHDVCGFVGPCGVSAWRWSGRSWQSTRIGWSTQVYAYPYTRGWHWIWTQRTGWLAVVSTDLRTQTSHRCQLGYRC